MKVIGAENLSDEEIALKITEGAQLISYQYCISVIVLTFRRSSDIYLFHRGESKTSTAISYAAISLFGGWWGIPWGPIYTIQSLINTGSGGTDHSQDFLNHVVGSINASKEPPTLLPVQNSPSALPLRSTEVPGVKTEKISGLAIASFCLGLYGVLPFAFLGSIPAIIMGHIALIQNKRRNSTKGNRLAYLGLGLGYLGIVISIVMVVFFINSPVESGR